MRVFLLSVFALAACGQGSEAVQEKPRTFKADDFLRQAMAEGLKEDGADREFVREFIAGKLDLFVLKCQICDAVRRGCSDYARSQAAVPPAPKDTGIPKDIVDELRQGARLARLHALERLVDRYVSRRQDRLKMTAEERRTLHATLEEWKKDGMRMKELGSPNFGDFCPSCNGAAKAK